MSESQEHSFHRELTIVRNVTDIDVPMPSMGGKCWLLNQRGIFVLERGPGVMRTIACTHAGSGNLQFIDGVPDERGFFPDDDMDPSDPKYYARNGRPFYQANPVVMGSWMLDAGFSYGLTVKVAGGHESAAPTASIVWMPHRPRPAK